MEPSKPLDMDRGVVFDSTQAYRYVLTRRWGSKREVATFIMLNPSTADAMKGDPTIRRCIGFANAWGYHNLMVVNLFAFRATDPADLFKAPDPIGPRNDEYVEQACAVSSLIICAWGAHKKAVKRAQDIHQGVFWMYPSKVKCLGKTAADCPRHPLYLAGNTMPEDFRVSFE